jgi:hypothetical protein
MTGVTLSIIVPFLDTRHPIQLFHVVLHLVT